MIRAAAAIDYFEEVTGITQHRADRKPGQQQSDHIRSSVRTRQRIDDRHRGYGTCKRQNRSRAGMPGSEVARR